MRYRLAALIAALALGAIASLGATRVTGPVPAPAPAPLNPSPSPDPCDDSGVSIDDFMVWDGAGTAGVPVRVDIPCPVAREITYETYDITAKDGQDYVGVKSGKLLLPAGVMSTKISIQIIRSVQPQAPKRFGIRLLSGATFRDPDATVTIYYQQN